MGEGDGRVVRVLTAWQVVVWGDRILGVRIHGCTNHTWDLTTAAPAEDMPLLLTVTAVVVVAAAAATAAVRAVLVEGLGSLDNTVLQQAQVGVAVGEGRRRGHRPY